ncbi:TonB-dependent receptor domain-containing protein [Paraferrimonas sedimenticola]|uniref:TonB-dependent receptor n=1 Tax=Paraferrimonas sedimenticola TaxID=375674 RepID=A0AA37VUB5_9GAMM|nr:TonB-dependent receptor [Paraferrimonas sedimenticola]GLP95769.1 TonB-dependent receptor [Paraferrimonas sedimenticola]
MHSNSILAKSVRSALILGLSAGGFSATTAIAAEEEASVERISVTGSRIKRTDLETASPITVTTAEDIKLSGFTNIEDVLNNLPQIEAAQTSQISNGATGNASLDLRGLGPNRTLVLINGRRLQPGGLNSEAADVNQIPAALIKRVEVMTGGGSSTYGADAVAGVVNFVMNDDFEGFQISAGATGYQHDNRNKYIQGLMDKRNFDYPTGNSGIDGKTYSIDVVLGGEYGNGKGHATAYATWKKADELLQGSRDYSSCALDDEGTGCGGSANAIVPNFFFSPVFDGEVDYGEEVFWGLNPQGTFTPDDGTNRYNYAPINHFQRPNERYSIGAFTNYEVNEHFRPYLEVNYMNDNTAAQIAESGTFFNTEYLFDYNNPLLSDAQVKQLQEQFGHTSMDDEFVAYIGKRNVEGGPRASLLQHNSFRIVAGAEGMINDFWSYDFSYQHGQTDSTETYINDFFSPKIQDAVFDKNGNGCGADCIPYEVFKYQGVTPEMASNLTGVGIRAGLTTQKVYNGFVSGEFDWAIPSASSNVAAVLGFERRELQYTAISDEVFEKGLLLGQGGATPSISGGYNVNEVFAELQVPLINDAVAAHSLLLDLGGRYSDYNTTGSDPTYKVGVEWAPIENWMLRASYNRASRAPNVTELFTSQNIGLWSGTDPCAGAEPIATQAQCANTGMTAEQYGKVSASPAGQYNQLSGGNLNLQPEKADTLTVGLVANPFEGFNFAVDYWDIQMSNVIGTAGSSLILENCAKSGNASFCGNVNRNAAGSLWIGEEGYVINLTDNLGGRHWRGVDISANYSVEVGGGTISAALNGVTNMKKEYEPISDLPEFNYDCSGKISESCFAQPKWRHTLQVSYDRDSWWAVTGKWRHYGKVNYEGGTDKLAEGGIKAQNYFDLVGQFYAGENVTFQLGVNNLFDKEPPLVGNTLSTNANAVASFYDTLGRFLHARVTLTF